MTLTVNVQMEEITEGHTIVPQVAAGSGPINRVGTEPPSSAHPIEPRSTTDPDLQRFGAAAPCDQTAAEDAAQHAVDLRAMPRPKVMKAARSLRLDDARIGDLYDAITIRRGRVSVSATRRSSHIDQLSDVLSHLPPTECFHAGGTHSPEEKLTLLLDAIKPCHLRRVTQQLELPHISAVLRKVTVASNADVLANHGRVLVVQSGEQLEWHSVADPRPHTEERDALVYWGGKKRRATVEKVRLNPHAEAVSHQVHYKVGGEFRPCGDEIRWLLTGRRLASRGAVVTHWESIHHTDDCRHDVLLPQLSDGRWLFEDQLQDVKQRLLARTKALTVARVDVVDARLALENQHKDKLKYVRVKSGVDLQPGQYYDDGEFLIKVRLQANTYPASAIGVLRNENVAFFGWNSNGPTRGYSSPQGLTLDAFSQECIDRGAMALLLVDEGLDVTLKIGAGYRLKPNRPKVRSVFCALPTGFLPESRRVDSYVSPVDLANTGCVPIPAYVPRPNWTMNATSEELKAFSDLTREEAEQSMVDPRYYAEYTWTVTTVDGGQDGTTTYQTRLMKITEDGVREVLRSQRTDTFQSSFASSEDDVVTSERETFLTDPTDEAAFDIFNSL